MSLPSHSMRALDGSASYRIYTEYTRFRAGFSTLEDFLLVYEFNESLMKDDCVVVDINNIKKFYKILKFKKELQDWLKS